MLLRTKVGGKFRVADGIQVIGWNLLQVMESMDGMDPKMSEETQVDV